MRRRLKVTILMSKLILILMERCVDEASIGII